MPNTPNGPNGPKLNAPTPRQQLHELDDQIRRCREQLAAADDLSPEQAAEQQLTLGTLIARRLLIIQWL